jgi:hypothetical protein
MFLSQIGVTPLKCPCCFTRRPALSNREDASEVFHVCSDNTDLMPVNPGPRFVRLETQAGHNLLRDNAHVLGPLGWLVRFIPSLTPCGIFFG